LECTPGPGVEHVTQKTWFITGASRGFGREWTLAALERGDRVAATARDTVTIDDLVQKYGDAVPSLRWTSPTGRPTSRPWPRRTSTSGGSTWSSPTLATVSSGSSRS
jgi:hypothetical protein